MNKIVKICTLLLRKNFSTQQMVTAGMKLKDTCSLEEKLWKT